MVYALWFMVLCYSGPFFVVNHFIAPTLAYRISWLAACQTSHVYIVFALSTLSMNSVSVGYRLFYTHFTFNRADGNGFESFNKKYAISANIYNFINNNTKSSHSFMWILLSRIIFHLKKIHECVLCENAIFFKFKIHTFISLVPIISEVKVIWYIYTRAELNAKVVLQLFFLVNCMACVSHKCSQMTIIAVFILLILTTKINVFGFRY